MFFGVKEGDKLVFALSSEIRLSKVTIIFLSSEPKYAPTVLARASTVLRTVHNWHELVRTFYFFFGVAYCHFVGLLSASSHSQKGQTRDSHLEVHQC